MSDFPRQPSKPDASRDDTNCCGDDCGCEPSLDRRTFVKLAGAASLAATAAPAVVAGPFDAADTADHFVPTDKKLSDAWVKQLFARGESTWYTGGDLETIGMPIGGICAGQVYLSGDGRLVYWDIFNQNVNSGYGQVNYKEGRKPTEMVQGVRRFVEAPAVDQGFAVQVKTSGGTVTKPLDAASCGSVRFCGEYPIARVQYADDALPVDIELEAFSPFIPLNADDSALPATLLQFTVKNTSSEKVEVTLAGWLQNAAGLINAERLSGTAQRANKVRTRPGVASVSGGLKPIKQAKPPARQPIVLADFEGDDYGDWKAEGEAFGKRPARGTLPEQQAVSGYRGQGLVNTYLDKDPPLGKLTSPEFDIERPWLSFLIGGGAYRGETCVNLLVDGKVVHTATGSEKEHLTPVNWSVRDLVGKRAKIEIVDAASGPWGHINADQFELRDEPMEAEIADMRLLGDFGSMGLAVLADDGLASVSLPDGDAAEVLFAADGLACDDAQTKPLDRPLRGAVGRSMSIPPGETATATFVVAWHMPNMHRGQQLVGNRYAERFCCAAHVIDYVADHLDRLATQTRLWHDTFYDSTLPYWLLDRLHSTVGNLATTTCQWWRNGRFWAWEGCGCCHGTCGHVWNYEHALARLFPELERSVRDMQDFADGVGFIAATGEIRFRGEGWGIWAGDSQGGYVLKAYREHQCAGDDTFLKRNWLNIRKATQFLIDQDGNADGVLEGRQHQTYDQNYFGANTMVGSLYLGALRAAEQMALEMGDEAFATTCRKIAGQGSAKSVDRLFNGEYFIQDVDLEKHPDWQYADGCLADQMFGQGWAHQVALGYVYPEKTVRSTLEAIWRYCWAPDIAAQNEQHKPERWFAYAGEAGLFTCTWPKSKHLGGKSTRYRNEVWTGIEYQVAGHMAWEGMLTETLAICRAIHDRYHPSKRNPFNEIECGDHYARALASWGVLTGLAGFEYHGPRGHLGFAPRIMPERFRAVFTAADGWGTIAQQRTGVRQTNTIEVAWGEVRLRSLALQATGDAPIAVRLDGVAIGYRSELQGDRLTITLPHETTIPAGKRFEVTIG